MPASPREPEEEGVVARFLLAYLENLDRGASVSLASYQARFPGFEAVIAEEWHQVQAQGLGPSVRPAIDVDRDAQAWLQRMQASADATEAAEPPELIGEGGMGSVYRDWDPELRRFVAKKVLRADAAGTPDKLLQRFLDEAQITGQLGHPGIVPVHRVGLDAEGRAYFTMELVRGESFAAVIRHVHEDGGEWNVAAALNVVQRVCDAVAFAHAKGVLHRDLKPSNLMVGRFGEAYVMDWGLARVIDRPDRHDLRVRSDDDSEPDLPLSSVHTHRRDLRDDDPDTSLVTMDGDVVGTPAYMAPEQAVGDIERMGPTADVYSLGAILYHLLSGHAPYVPSGARISSRTLLARVVEGPPASLRSQGVKVAPALEAIVVRAMARDAADRYATAAELGADLRAFSEGRVVRAHRTGAIAEFKQWVGRNRLAAGALGLAVVSLVGGIAWSLFERQRAEAHAVTAQEAEADATRKAEVAVGNFQVAFSAAQSLVDTVLSAEMRSLPGSGPVLAALSEEAERYMGHLARSAVHDPRLGLRMAQVYLKLALLCNELKRWPKGEVCAQTAVEWFESRQASPLFGEMHGHEMRLAKYLRCVALTQRGETAIARDMLTDLVKEVRAAAPEARQISGELPKLGYDNLVSTLTLLANLTPMAEEAVAKEQLRAEAINVADRAAAQRAEDIDSWESLSNMCRYQANDMRTLQRWDEANGLLERAVAAAEKGLELVPDNRDLSFSLGAALFHYGTTRGDTGAELLERAESVLAKLCEAHPDFGRYALELGGARCNLGNAYGKEGRFREGAEKAESGLAPLRLAFEQKIGGSADYLRTTYWRAAVMWIQAEQPERVAPLARALFETLPSPGNAERAARLLADAAYLAKEPPDTPDGYGAEAVGLLRKALISGFEPTVPLTGDRYGNFRGRPGFAEILERMSGK